MKKQVVAAAVLGIIVGAAAALPLRSIAQTGQAQTTAESQTAGGPAAEGVTVSVSPSGVRVVKQALNRLGYSAGPVTGVWNEAVGQALLHFQQAHGLEPTGNLNISSIAALGLWTRLVGDPLGNQRKALETVEDLTGAPSQGAAQGGNPLISSIPSQRVTNEAPGGSTTGAGGENTQPAPQRQAGPRAKTRTHRKP